MVSSVSSTMTGAVDFAQMQKQLLKRADSDGDNRLSLTEFESAKPKDAPSDGPSSSEIFNSLDANQDGYLTEEELTAGAEKMGPPPGGMPPAPTQSLSEDGLKSLLDLLAEELKNSEETSSDTTSSSDSTASSDTTVSSAGATDESESAAQSGRDEEEKALELIQQFITEYRSAQASYMSAQNLVAGPGSSVSTVS